MRGGGFEPPKALSHQVLSLARLATPASPRVVVLAEVHLNNLLKARCLLFQMLRCCFLTPVLWCLQLLGVSLLSPCPVFCLLPALMRRLLSFHTPFLCISLLFFCHTARVSAAFFVSGSGWLRHSLLSQM